MIELASNVYLLQGVPNYFINIYLIDDVVIDGGTRLAARGILKQLEGRKVSAHALTHVHPDHQGSSHAICSKLNVPLWCGAEGVHTMETGDFSTQVPPGRKPPPAKLMAGPPHKVDRVLKEGDQVGSFEVIATPGHALEHLSFWRASDGVLILGDVFFNMNVFTFRHGLQEAPASFIYDKAQNKASAEKIVALEPKLICFGHGKPSQNFRELAEFVDNLP